MAEAKTTITEVAVDTFIAGVEPPAKREDARVLDALFRKVTAQEPKMWGPTMIGYGRYTYRYASGHGGTFFRAGFSPRKAKHSLYIMDCGDADEEAAFAALLARLGKHSRGKACLYVNKLADIDLDVVEQMIALGWKRSFARWPD
ncbi:DUF1801 domain-containing protein [Erythrobacter donghaensis]|jgi:hypothetical protein|uniref:DUF1801 domain-containing protein n=1 Tax=Erythrobacter donghaensis TaxID=267135 RepID=UPI00093F4BEA|nr:DUF1801 domain-containing protein [Erythrobacter donghaensis]